MTRKPTKRQGIGDEPLDPYVVAFGKNVEATRKRLGMTIKTLSETSEMSDMACWLIEVGQRNPTLKTIKKIAEALNTTPQALLPDNDESFWKGSKPILPGDFAQKFQSTVELSAQCSERWNRLLEGVQHVPELRASKGSSIPSAPPERDAEPPPSAPKRPRRVSKPSTN